MAGPTKDSTSDKNTTAQFSESVKQSAQQIWLAGLGAFAKAQQEGGKAFEALVKDGVSMQKKTQAAAEEKISEVTQRVASLTTDLTSRASGQWDKLEGIFEDRVARSLTKLGVPSSRDIDSLNARIDELQAAVARLGAGRESPARRAASKRASPAAAAKRATGRQPR